MPQWYEGWTDVTYPIFENMTGWPDQPPTHLETQSDIHCGADARVSILHLSVHTGTHTDAPSHFLAQGQDISRYDLTAGIGPCRVAALPGAGPITIEAIQQYEARTEPLRPGDRLLCRTDNSDRTFWPQEPFDVDYRGVSPEGAAYLVARRLRLIGVDYLSVGPYAHGNPQTHRALLGGGVWILEGLDLRRVAEGRYEMISLPLKIAGGDAAPTRVLLKNV